MWKRCLLWGIKVSLFKVNMEDTRATFMNLNVVSLLLTLNRCLPSGDPNQSKRFQSNARGHCGVFIIGFEHVVFAE